MNGLTLLYILAAFASILGLFFAFSQKKEGANFKVKMGNNTHSKINIGNSGSSSIRWLVYLGLFIAFLAFLYLASKDIDILWKDNSISFCELEVEEVGILVLPFQSYSENVNTISNYQKPVIDILNELKYEHDLPINVQALLLPKNHPGGQVGQALQLAEERCAKIVVWGSYDESGTLPATDIRFALVDPYFFKGASEAYGKLELNQTRPIDLSRNFSIKKVEDLALVVGAMAAYEIGAYKKAKHLLELMKPMQLGETCDALKYYLDWTSIYWFLGAPERSEEYARKALAIFEEKHCDNAIDKAKALDELSVIYSTNYSRDQEAIAFSKEAIAIAETTSEAQDSLLGFYHTNLANAHFNLGDINNAIIHQKQAIAYFERSIKTENKWMLAIAIVNLGVMQIKLGQFEMGQKNLEKGYEMEKIIYPKEHGTIATTLSLFSKLYWRLGDIDKAVQYQEEALAIRKKVLPDNHILLSNSYHNLSKLKSSSLTDIHTALNYEKKAIHIVETQSKVDTQNLVTMYSQLFDIHMLLNDQEQAIPYLDKAYDLALQFNGENPKGIDFIFPYNDYAFYHSQRKEYEQALAYHDSIIMIVQPYIDDQQISPASVATIWQNRSVLFARLEQCDSASFYAHASLEKLGELEGELPRSLTGTYNSLAIASQCEGKLEIAMDYAQKVNSYYTQLSSRSTRQDMSFARGLDLLANLYISKGDVEIAQDLIHQALELSENKLPNGYYVVDDIKKTQQLLESKLQSSLW